jgi:electron transport complex protein RnfD
VLFNLLLASAAALACEAGMLWLRGRPPRPFLSDYSALVSAWLVALAVPPLAPWWMTVLAVCFGLIFAKHLYGGLGYNPFNPAMAGYAILLISFPLEMTWWPKLESLGGYYFSPLDALAYLFAGTLPNDLSLDAITSATPLDVMRARLGQAYTVGEIKSEALFGHFGSRGWEWVYSAYLLGGLWLLYRRVITWHIPLSVLGGLFLLAGFFFILDPDTHPSPLFHIFTGASILCAFFIATDPVSAATSRLGRLFYGAGIGVLIYVIRTWGGYPDAVAFAVLLMNMSAPMLDYYTKPRVFGHK